LGNRKHIPTQWVEHFYRPEGVNVVLSAEYRF